MRQLDALAGTGKDHAMVADDIPAARRGKADRPRLAFAGHAVAAEYAIILEVAPKRLRCRVAQQQRGARRRVDLVPVMHLDDLHVVADAQELRALLDQAQEHVDAHAHIRRENDSNRFSEVGERALVGGRQAGRADHRRHAGAGTRGDMRERAFGPRKIDQYVGSGHRGGNVRRDFDAGGRAEALTRVAAEKRTCRDIQRTGEHHVGFGERRFEQRLAHPAAGACDNESYCHQPSFLSRSCSQVVSPVFGAVESDLSSTASPPPARATSAGGGGISSPSQRASRSSTK